MLERTALRIQGIGVVALLGHAGEAIGKVRKGRVEMCLALSGLGDSFNP
jgi:hypothetical protein